jgi:hypothetical protein
LKVQHNNDGKKLKNKRIEAEEDLHIGGTISSDDSDGDDENEDDEDDDVDDTDNGRRGQRRQRDDINEDNEDDDAATSNGKRRRIGDATSSSSSSSSNGNGKGPRIQYGLDGPKRMKAGPEVAVVAQTDEWEDEAASDDEKKGKGVHKKGEKPQRGRTGRSHGGEDPEEAFEEVPVEELSSDDDAVAERLAIGTLMLRKKKRGDVTESSYSRYSFGDEDDAPSWFVEDESFHNRAQLPVTKEQVRFLL